MELPETGEQYSTEIGEGEAPTFAAETWSMQISEKQNKRQSDRIATKTRGGHTQEHSLCSAVQRRPTELCQNHPENHLRELSGTKTSGEKARRPHQSDEDAESKDAFVLPPHLAPHGACTTAESRRLTCHAVCLVNQQFYAFPTAEDLLHVLDHDVLHLSEFGLRAGQVIRRRRRIVRVHEL